MKTLILLIVLLSMSSCKTTYNYIVITPAKEVKKPEVKPCCVVPDRWTYPDPRQLKTELDSIANILNHDAR